MLGRKIQQLFKIWRMVFLPAVDFKFYDIFASIFLRRKSYSGQRSFEFRNYKFLQRGNRDFDFLYSDKFFSVETAARKIFSANADFDICCGIFRDWYFSDLQI